MGAKGRCRIVPAGVGAGPAHRPGAPGPVSYTHLEIVSKLKAITEKYHLDRKYIQLEITESSMAENETAMQNIIANMHREGFDVLLDDFGVGYSSLATVAAMQFDVLKIDKSFIDAIGSFRGNEIIQYTIMLARKLGMKTVAEGVEQEAQYQLLKDFQCDEIQGYYFSKPLAPEDFSAMLQSK